MRNSDGAWQGKRERGRNSVTAERLEEDEDVRGKCG